MLADHVKGERRAVVLAWISETFFHIVSWIPNWLYPDDTPRYLVVRGMLGLLLIVLVILAIGLWRGRRRRSRTREMS